MSVLVGPFDGQMSQAREVLGVQLWDVLSADDRKSVLADLVMTWSARSPALTVSLRQATASLSPDGRARLKSDLQAQSALGEPQLVDIGL